MIPPQRISEVLNAFKAGKFPREEYWSKMQEIHLGLQEYGTLIRRGNLERIEICADELHIVLKNRLKMLWNPTDIRSAPNMVVNHGEYEPQELAVLQILAKSCSVMLDIGANAGWYSLHLAFMARETGGRVYAIEPVPQTFDALTRNVQLNGYNDTITAFCLALGDSDQMVKLYIPNFSGSAATSQQLLFPDDANQIIECQAVTLDGFVTKQQIDRLDLIKCDVEGAELFVIRGGVNTIERHKPIIMLEMLRKWARIFGYHPNDIISLLEGRGYRCWSYEDGQFNQVREISEECKQTNFFFLHDGKHDALADSVNQALAAHQGPGSR